MNSDEIKKAMVNLTHVIHRGIEYQRISAYIYRIYVSPNSHKYREVFQVELLDKNGQSVTIADPKEIELKDGEGWKK